jgi:hypothetical protein
MRIKMKKTKKMLCVISIFALIASMALAYDENKSLEKFTAVIYCLQNSGGKIIAESEDENATILCKLMDGMVCDVVDHFNGLCPYQGYDTPRPSWTLPDLKNLSIEHMDINESNQTFEPEEYADIEFYPEFVDIVDTTYLKPITLPTSTPQTNPMIQTTLTQTATPQNPAAATTTQNESEAEMIPGISSIIVVASLVLSLVVVIIAALWSAGKEDNKPQKK